MIDKKAAFGFAITAGRYVIAEKMARNVSNHESITKYMAAFVITDILDGVIMRRLDADTPMRRLVDGIVDYASMARVGSNLQREHPEADIYTKTLMARNAGVAAINLYHSAKTGEVTKTPAIFNKLATVSIAAFASVTAGESKPLTKRISGMVASGLSLATVPQYFKGLGQQHEDGVRVL